MEVHLKQCPWDVHGPPVRCPWPLCGLSMGCPRAACELSTGRLLMVRGLPVDSSCAANPMELS